MALVRKSATDNQATSPQKHIIKVNPYENAENVMDLMAKICSALPSTNTNIFWDIINDAYNKIIHGSSLSDYLSENRNNLLNRDFKQDLKDLCYDIELAISTYENTEHTQVVVAGGFSSGKSSFLNKLTKNTNLLPTGVEPVSVVKTYIYCSKNCNSISVKGVNQKNVLVNLNTGVLQAIQHAKKSNVYLASVLDKIFVEIPSNKLNGLVFIDTPGYNNSDKENVSNGKTDRDTALEAFSEGNVLLWMIPADKGTVPIEDIKMIKQFNGKKLFIFNKADKIGKEDSKYIVENASTILYNEFNKEDVIDIIAYSTLEDKIYYSKNQNYNFSSIINSIKKSGNGNTQLEDLKYLVSSLFEDEIDACKNTIQSIEENYKNDVEYKDNTFKEYSASKRFKDYIINELSTVLIDNYNELLKAADRITDSSLYALNSFEDFFNGVMDFENNDHWGSSKILNAAIDKANKTYDKACNKHNLAIKYQYYTEDYRKELVAKVESEEDFIVNKFKEWYEQACNNCENYLNRREREEKMIKDMIEYRRTFMAALEMAIRMYQQQNKSINIHDVKEDVPNIFECINNDDYKSFLHSFENGVDLSTCNSEGYNPLTFAVKKGNNEMVKFMLKNNANPNLLDKRGYNAFHTAVENQYKDICEILLDFDDSLIYTVTAGNESVEDLAMKKSFAKWIQNKI